LSIIPETHVPLNALRVALSLGALAIAVALLGPARVAQARPALSGSAVKLPPWNPPEVGPYQFSVHGVDDVVDLHGDPKARNWSCSWPAISSC
jgi:hypothetical protein